ncbi:hypothetical protein CJ030_MR0G027754 [Morella rubra]|uniref:Uncharacterized protein n=1 Tax=Morella rubra TaxID=262757 RepID=A0A6A1UFW6_9ROSI|nr:hypothetical protein CJ030_MR0G027754 [Morella rubra]
MAGNGGRVVINIGRLASSIEETMSQDLLMLPKCCIFRVPYILYGQNKEAFTPDAFSIGPLQHGHPNLKTTEQIKFKYLRCLIDRSKTRLIELISSVKDLEIEAWEYYAEPIRYTPKLYQIPGIWTPVEAQHYAFLVCEDCPFGLDVCPAFAGGGGCVADVCPASAGGGCGVDVVTARPPPPRTTFSCIIMY